MSGGVVGLETGGGGEVARLWVRPREEVLEEGLMAAALGCPRGLISKTCGGGIAEAVAGTRDHVSRMSAIVGHRMVKQTQYMGRRACVGCDAGP
jgi:hypothetical protein